MFDTFKAMAAAVYFLINGPAVIIALAIGLGAGAWASRGYVNTNLQSKLAEVTKEREDARSSIYWWMKANETLNRKESEASRALRDSRELCRKLEDEVRFYKSTKSILITPVDQ